MLQPSVFLLCFTLAYCDGGYGHGFSGGFGGGQAAAAGFGGSGPAAGFGGPAAAACKPVTQFVTNVQTVVQEATNINTVQENVAQFETSTSLDFATVTTGTTAYVTTTVLVTDYTTITRTVARQNRVTSTQLVYIPTLQTATLPVVRTQTLTTTEVAYSTLFRTTYVTTTRTTVSTKLQDSVVYDVAYETELNFVAAPVATTVTDVIQDITTQTLQVQGYLPPDITVTLDNVEYTTQVQYETAPVYFTSTEQVTQYQTVYRDVHVTNTVTATVDCNGQAVKGGVSQGSVSDSTPGGSGGYGGFQVQPGVLVNHNSQVDIGSNYL